APTSPATLTSATSRLVDPPMSVLLPSHQPSRSQAASASPEAYASARRAAVPGVLLRPGGTGCGVASRPGRAPRVARIRAWWRRPGVIEAAATAIFTIYVAWPYLSFSQFVTSYDTVTYGGPNLAYFYQNVKAGHLPIWNDSIFNGVPNAANANAAIF